MRSNRSSARLSSPVASLQLLEVAFASVAESNVLKEAIVSITTLGSAVGGFVGGFASDYYGRRVSTWLLPFVLVPAQPMLRRGGPRKHNSHKPFRTPPDGR